MSNLLLSYFYYDTINLVVIIMRQDFIKIKLKREINPLERYIEIESFGKNYLVKNKDNNLYGIINYLGKEVIPSVYEREELTLFLNRLKYVDDFNNDNFLIICKKDGMSGFKDLNNKLIIPYKYQKAYPFSEDLAAVKIDRTWGFINSNNQLEIPFMYQAVKSFSDGLAAVKLNDKWGFIDKFNQIIIPFKYEFASSFIGEYTIVRENGEYILIDKNGNKITKFIEEIKFINNDQDIPNNTKEIEILEYLSVFELDDQTIIVKDSNLEKYLDSVVEIEREILIDKTNYTKTLKLK